MVPCEAARAQQCGCRGGETTAPQRALILLEAEQSTREPQRMGKAPTWGEPRALPWSHR